VAYFKKLPVIYMNLSLFFFQQFYNCTVGLEVRIRERRFNN